MHFHFILLIIFLSYLRRSLRTKERDPRMHRLFTQGIVLAALCIAAELFFPVTAKVSIWVGYALLFYLLYYSIYKKEYQAARSFAFALLPFLALSLIEDIIKLVSKSFYREWENYFQLADVFAFIWLISMLYVNNKQRKALEKERLKAEVKQKEYEITESLKKELEVQVAERTADLEQQKQSLEQTLNELKATQGQLIQSEKMASLGELTAGIAHEIQNPLNFVNNFSEVSNELITEMMDEIDKGNAEEVKAIAGDVQQNLEKILHHGKRADAIVKGMLQHSRSSTGVKEPVDINALADEYFRLAYHGLRAKNKSFNASIHNDFDPSILKINIIPQDVGRVLLNLLTNAFYAVTEKKNILIGTEKDAYQPTVTVTTKDLGSQVQVVIKDNGNGIPENVFDKIFQPFFTTKPTGQGTGLGLSMSYDIITKGHSGQLLVKTKEKEGTEFIIKLPK